VKYIRYQLETVDAPRALVKRWLALGDELGWEHDHTVLIGVCKAQGADEGFRSVAEHSRIRREELRSGALDAGNQLFLLEPGAFVEAVASKTRLEAG
jgi:hypothetical protein